MSSLRKWFVSSHAFSRKGCPQLVQSSLRWTILLLALCNGVVASDVADSTNIAETSDVSWQPIPAADLSAISVDDFADHELDLPFYLAHFHQIANAVVAEGPHKGFIDISVWRRRPDNKPTNARIMESILSLAYFYTTDRPWNIYFQSPQLRLRLEAALTYWCNMQGKNGRFTETSPRRQLAATAFATKFIGESLQLLQGDDVAIDADLYQRSVAALRKAVYVVLTDKKLWKYGTAFTNQYSNVWSGALAYLNLPIVNGDEEISALLEQRFADSVEAFQSPAGYFYESNGSDFRYSLRTHDNNLVMALHYAAGTPMGEGLIAKIERYAAWLSWNAVPETQHLFFLNRSIEMRKLMPVKKAQGAFLELAIPRSDETPIFRPFLASKDDVLAETQAKRQELRDRWPEVDPLQIGEFFAYSPYIFLNRRVSRSYPSEAQRQDALAKLPCYHTGPRITTLRDTRKNVLFTYINMPDYYAVFNHGEILDGRQKYGLCLLWSKSTGTIWQSQTAHRTAFWHSKSDTTAAVEANSLSADLRIDGKDVSWDTPSPTVASSIEITYSHDGIDKRLTFNPTSLQIEVTAQDKNQNLTETLPLIVDQQSDVAVKDIRCSSRNSRGRWFSLPQIHKLPVR